MFTVRLCGQRECTINGVFTATHGDTVWGPRLRPIVGLHCAPKNDTPAYYCDILRGFGRPLPASVAEFESLPNVVLR